MEHSSLASADYSPAAEGCRDEQDLVRSAVDCFQGAERWWQDAARFRDAEDYSRVGPRYFLDGAECSQAVRYCCFREHCFPDVQMHSSCCVRQGDWAVDCKVRLRHGQGLRPRLGMHQGELWQPPEAFRGSRRRVGRERNGRSEPA